MPLRCIRKRSIDGLRCEETWACACDRSKDRLGYQGRNAIIHSCVGNRALNRKFASEWRASSRAQSTYESAIERASVENKQSLACWLSKTPGFDVLRPAPRRFLIAGLGLAIEATSGGYGIGLVIVTVMGQWVFAARDSMRTRSEDDVAWSSKRRGATWVELASLFGRSISQSIWRPTARTRCRAQARSGRPNL